jgi:uncharacterized OB-fold protein
MSNFSDKLDTTGPDLKFFSFLQKNIFALPKCKNCGKFHFFPRIICPYCGEFELVWQTVSGEGKVYSTTTIRRKPERGGDYNVCLITLKEGPRMMSTVENIAAELVEIGDKVFASINNDGDEPFIIFTPGRSAKK